MSPALKSLGIDRMSVEERIALAEAIWDSIAEEAEQEPLTEAQKQEIDRRLEAHRADPGNVIPWETVKAEALARMRK